MNREFYCSCCGLYFWEEPVDFKYTWSCPACRTSNHQGTMIWAVDTYAFFYFTKSKSYNPLKSWSSPAYAPQFAIDIYRKQGMMICNKHEDYFDIHAPKKESMKHRFKKRFLYKSSYADLHFKDDRTEYGQTKDDLKRKPHGNLWGKKPTWRAKRRNLKRGKMKR
jgi:hypothetical protein